MSVDGKLFINSKYSINEIQAVLDREFKTKSRAIPSGVDCSYIVIEAEIMGEKRRFSVFLNSQLNGFNGTSLSLKSNGNAILALQTLAHTFGGFLCKADTDEIYEGYAGKLAESDGLAFWVRSAIIDGINPDSAVELREYIQKVKSKWARDDETSFK